MHSLYLWKLEVDEVQKSLGIELEYMVLEGGVLLPSLAQPVLVICY